MSGLRFGKTLLCLKTACQITHKESVEELFFNSFTNDKKNNSVKSFIETIFEKNPVNTEQAIFLWKTKDEIKECNYKEKAEEIAMTNNENLNNQANFNHFIPIQLPTYLNAYYNSLLKKNNLDIITNSIHNSLQNSGSNKQTVMTANNPFTTCFLNNLRNPFLFQMPQQTQTFV